MSPFKRLSAVKGLYKLTFTLPFHKGVSEWRKVYVMFTRATHNTAFPSDQAGGKNAPEAKRIPCGKNHCKRKAAHSSK